MPTVIRVFARTGSGRQMDAVLVQQGFVDGFFLQPAAK